MSKNGRARTDQNGKAPFRWHGAPALDLGKIPQPDLIRADVATDLAMMLRRFIWAAERQPGDSSAKVLAGKARELLVRHGLQGSPLRE
jgi:hypothetical protein